MGTMQREKRIGRELSGKARVKVMRCGPKQDGRFERHAERAFAHSFRELWKAANDLRKSLIRLGNVMGGLPPEFEAAIWSDLDSLYED